MSFDKEKESAIIKLNNDDRSRKGSVDILISPLINEINKSKDYYTTSSCSGRIMVYPKTSIRQDVKWIYVTHDYADLNDLSKNIEKLQKDQIWFKQESFILHIVARDIESASKLISMCRKIGLKRAGINSIRKTSGKITIEVINHLGFDMPIAENGILLINNDFLKKIIDIANKNMKCNQDKIIQLTKEFSSIN